MNESPVRKFCESPHRKLIVIIATVLFGLVVLIPLVDDYFDGKSNHSTLTGELDLARQMAESLPTAEKVVAGIKTELAAFESRAISNESMSQYRTNVVGLVRETECHVRRFDVSRPTQRPWMTQDNPLNTAAPNEEKNQKTPFALERRNVVLVVDGTMEGITGLLKQLYKDDSLAYLHRLDLKSASRGGEQVSMEIEMWLFTLSRLKT